MEKARRSEDYRKEMARLDYSDLKQAVREFFEIMERRETSTSGREFHPTTINSCREADRMRLDGILRRMKDLSNG